MIRPTRTVLFHVPEQQYVAAEIVTLTPAMADERIRDGWWGESCLKDRPNPEPIDRWWNWNEVVIRYENRVLDSEKVAIVAGDEGSVQGAMMISAEPVPSMLARGRQGLFVELLFTAPRNRPDLRMDGKPFLRGVGIELLTWGARFSREKGCEGRLLLDGSPDYVTWYEKRGLQRLNSDPMFYERVQYTPMELPPEKAQELLEGWEAH